MDPATLIAPSNPLGYPAPYWFLVLFKVLGFVLHSVPMNLWYVGIIMAMLLRISRDENARLFSNRLMKQMPIIIALGINLGIVPLLFVQVAYYKAFYPATILMAWPWLAIIVLLTIAYYGIYIYSYSLKKTTPKTSRLSLWAGWISAFFFVAIGFIFVNGFSLMANLSAWPEIWKNTSVAGAPLGIALNTGDISIWPRWLMMIGLAMMTTAIYSLFDCAFMAAGESAGYKRWINGFAFKLYTVGMLWYAVFGFWYSFGTWSAQTKQVMFAYPALLLTAVTAVSPGLVWLILLSRFRREPLKKTATLLLAIIQFLVLGFNGISRQIVQNIDIGIYFDVTAEQVNIQWSPMILFLLLFVAGLLTIIWLLNRAIGEARRTAA